VLAADVQVGPPGGHPTGEDDESSAAD